jgi:hypothetical protein
VPDIHYNRNLKRQIQLISRRHAKMPIQETLSLQFANYLSSRLNRDKDRQAVNWMSKLVDNVNHCQRAGVTYGLGSWGYTGQFSLLLPLALTLSCK